MVRNARARERNGQFTPVVEALREVVVDLHVPERALWGHHCHNKSLVWAEAPVGVEVPNRGVATNSI